MNFVLQRKSSVEVLQGTLTSLGNWGVDLRMGPHPTWWGALSPEGMLSARIHAHGTTAGEVLSQAKNLLISDVSAPELWDNISPLLSASHFMVLCDGSPRRSLQYGEVKLIYDGKTKSLTKIFPTLWPPLSLPTLCLVYLMHQPNLPYQQAHLLSREGHQAPSIRPTP